LVAIFGHSDRELTSIGRSCRLVIRVVLCVLAISSSQNSVVGQENTRSHRLLGNGLPTLSGGQSQMELFRRLQMLSGAAQAAGKTPADSPLADPDALKRLQQAMQSLQKLTSDPSGDSARSPQLPPSLTDRSLDERRNSEPSQQPPGQQSGGDTPQPGSTPDRSALQRIAEKMGLSLDNLPGTPPTRPGTPPDSRSSEQPSPGTDRKSPPPNGDGSAGKRGPTQSGNSNTFPERIPQGGPRPGQRADSRNSRTGAGKTGAGKTGAAAGDTTSERGQPGRSTSRPDSLPQTPDLPRTSEGTATDKRTPGGSPSLAPGSEPGTGEPPKSSMQTLLDWLKKKDQSASGNGLPSDLTGTPPDGPPSSRSATPGNGRSGQPGTNPGRSPQSSGRPRDNQARDDSANAGMSNQGEPATSDNSWFPGGSIAPPRSQQENTRGNQDRMNRGVNQAGTAGRPSTGSENAGGNSSVTNSGAANSPAGNSHDDAESLRQSIEDRLNAQREERLDEVRGSKKTLRQKLAEIAKLARSESDRAEPSENGTESETGDGLQSAFVDALAEATKGLAEQVDEIVTDDRFSRRGRDRRSSRRDRDGPFGQFAGLGNRANEWFVDAVEPPAASTSIMSNGLSRGGPGGSAFSPRLLAGLFIICGLVFWLLQKKRNEAQSQSAYPTLSPAPTNLQSRQDIVQAFHDLAARCPAVMADWWTHDRAAQALATSRPDIDDEVRQLAQLYEQARYLPAESALTDEQLSAAKAAWLRCRKS
jgi:hypothetical protein